MSSSKLKKNREQTLIEKYKAIQAIGHTVQVPFSVKRAFQGDLELIIMGNQVSFGEDYLYIEEAREVVQYFVEQMGGKVEWEN